MKKIIFTGFAVATLILAAVSCQKAEFEGGNAPGGSSENLVPMTITASLEADTKAALQEGGKVFWEAGDGLSVFSINSADEVTTYEFTTDDAGLTADFTGLVDEEIITLSNGLYAVYPNNNSTFYPYIRTVDNSGNLTSNTYWQHTVGNAEYGKLRLFFPSLQKASSIENSKFRAVSAGIVDKTNHLGLKNVGGLVAINIPVGGISEVLFYGNANETISGMATAAFSSNIPTVNQTVGGNVVRMVPSSGSSFNVGTYYINIPPTTFTKGVSIVYVTKDSNKEDTFAVVRSSDTFVVKRSQISSLPTVSNLEFSGKVVRIIARTDSGANSSNFSSIGGSNTGTKEVSFKYPTSLDEYNYEFTIQGTKRYGYNTGNGWGLIWGGANGDYVEFPAIAGYALNKVVLVSGQTTTALGSPVVTDSQGSVLAGCESWSATTKAQGVANIWSFAGTANTSYRLATTGTTNCSAQQIHLYYAEKKSEAPAVTPLILNLESVPVVDYQNMTINMRANISATDYSSESQFTGGFQYKKSAEDEWIDIETTCEGMTLSAGEISADSRNSNFIFRPWVSFTTKSGNEKIVYGDETQIDMSRIVLSLVFNDSYWTKTEDGDNANFLSREWGWYTNQNNSDMQKTNLAPMNGKSYDFEYNGVGYPFTFYSLQGVYYDKSGKSTLSPGGYTLRVATGSETTYGLCMNYINSSTFTGPYPAWMQFPGIDGFRLAQVKTVTYSKNGYKIASDVVTDTEAAETVLGTAKEDCVIAEATNVYNATLDLNDTNAGQRYYLCTTENRVTFKSLTLTYEYAGE